MFPELGKSRYTLTHDDIISINEMMDVTYGWHLRTHTDKGEHARKSFFMFAVNPRDNTWYTGQGETVCEAVDNWFERVAEGSVSLRRWDLSTNRITHGWAYIPGHIEGKEDIKPENSSILDCGCRAKLTFNGIEFG